MDLTQFKELGIAGITVGFTTLKADESNFLLFM